MERGQRVFALATEYWDWDAAFMLKGKRSGNQNIYIDTLNNDRTSLDSRPISAQARRHPKHGKLDQGSVHRGAKEGYDAGAKESYFWFQ